jgi:hypothetical protein
MIVTPRYCWRAGTAMRLGMVLLSLAVVSSAATLDPGSLIVLSGTTLVQTPALGGTTIASQTVSFELLPSPPPFNQVPPAFRGEVLEHVVRESATNTLDFYYQLVVDPASEIVSPSIGTEFFGTTDSQLTTDVDFLSDSQGVGAAGMEARRLAGRQLINFFIGEPEITGTPVGAGDSSKVFYIRTNATEFDSGGAVYVDYNGQGSAGAVMAGAFEPVFVPEPSALPEPNTAGSMTLALFALSAGCFRTFRRSLNSGSE